MGPIVQGPFEDLGFTVSEKGMSRSRYDQTLWQLCGEQTVRRPG